MINKTVLACMLLIAMSLHEAGAQEPEPSVASKSDLLLRLQAEDEAFFASGLLDFDRAYMDSLAAKVDSLGFDKMVELQKNQSRPTKTHLSYGLATRLIDFNRAEGFVLGVGTRLQWSGPTIRAQGAYATHSEKFRYYGEIVDVVSWFPHRVRLFASFEDRVRFFGTNRPIANAFRALVAGADERDYLRFRGGATGFRFRPTRKSRVAFVYEAGQERSIGASTKYSIAGSMSRTNPVIAEGTRRTVYAHFEWGNILEQHQEMQIRHSVSGGHLGGDFTFVRTDVMLKERRYLGRQEFLAGLHFANTTSRTPTQNLADLGGMSTIRGYDRRSRVGQRALALRLEHHMPYDFLKASNIRWARDWHLQFVPWVDGGRVWLGSSEEWATSAGFGLQRFMGPFERYSFLRLDLAVPLGPQRDNDFTIELRFAPLFIGS